MCVTTGVEKSYERLSKNVQPKLYKIELKPDLEKFTFTGKETIDVIVVQETNEIALNVREVEIHEATFQYLEAGPIKGEVSIVKKDEKAFIKFQDNLKPGQGVLSLTFQGVLNDKMAGFYRCKYKSLSGEEKYSASTQFEATDARRAFPCWDEPAFKAQFEITLIAPKDRTVLSNTDPVEEKDYPDHPNLRVIRFARTPIMSSYLVAFVIGEYDYLETNTVRGTRIRVYTPMGKKEQGTFALSVASKCLSLFEDFFNIPYPLVKLDHVAIPDFASGAMENWGLITYRETRILADPLNTSSASREAIAKTIAHETAHQWFGNLVTMDWWTDLWLKEGFARFLEHLAVDTIFPQFEIWSQFVNTATLRAYRLDSLRNSHEIEVPVNHPDELEAIFDEISYDKGACLIRMCHEWVGPKAFREGLQQYLKDHSYGNAVTQDLWNALEKASGKPVGKTMPYWTKQRGYPVVRVESKPDDNGVQLLLEQKKFVLNGKLLPSEEESFWMIPVAVLTSENPKESKISELMSSRTWKVNLPNLTHESWIKLNPNIHGFYRVNYSPSLLEALKPAISTFQLSPTDRMQIINDLFALAMSGQVATVEVLKLFDSYSNEESYVPWCTIDSCFAKLNMLLSYTDFHHYLNKFGLELYSKIYEKLGFSGKNDSTHSQNLLRALVIHRLAQLKHEDVLKESTKRYRDHIDGRLIDPDLRKPIYSAVASSCDELSFEKFFKQYNATDLQEEKMRIGTALGVSNDRRKIRSVLNFALSDRVRNQDAWALIVSTTSTREGEDEAWKFFKENAQEFRKRYGTHHAAALLVENLISGFALETEKTDVERFFKENPFPGHENVIVRSLEVINANIDWLSRETESVKQFFISRYSS